jgi:hypothetical protein
MEKEDTWYKGQDEIVDPGASWRDIFHEASPLSSLFAHWVIQWRTKEQKQIFSG